MGTNGTDDFQKLLEDVVKNPERLLSEDLSEDQLLEVQKHLNPYAYVAGGGGEKKRVVAASYTNLRADYLRRFTTTALVGFVFRMLEEWEPSEEARRWAVPAEGGAGKEAFGAEELHQKAQALGELTRLARDAAAEADGAVARARALDQALEDSRLAGEPEGDRGAALAEALRAADKALSASWGLRYAATATARQLGRESDERIDDAARQAREYPEAREVMDRHPIAGRKPAGTAEIPAAEAKALVGRFLRAWFEYNPDAHVRSAYDEFVTPPGTLAEVPGLGPRPADPGDPSRFPLEGARGPRPEPATEADREAVARLTATPELYNAAAALIRDGAAGAAFARAAGAPGGPGRLRELLFPVPPGSPARAAVDVVPPQDTFHRLQYYTEVNYEALRTATEAIYHEKPDLDWALILYDYFEGTPAEVDAAFERFHQRHQDEVITDIKGLEMGGWSLLGDFKENREKINFYNKNTSVLKRILDRHAEDKKMGMELMKDRIRQKKAENIRREGPDDPGLESYRATLGGGGGAERVISRQEMLRLEKARGDRKAAKELEHLEECERAIETLTETGKLRPLRPEEERELEEAQKGRETALEMIEVPPDAIQVDVWTHDSEKGTFGKSKFYTKAEDLPASPERGAPPPGRRDNLADGGPGPAPP